VARRPLLSVALGSVLLFALAGCGQRDAARTASAADQRYVVVVERHVRHEQDLAAAAAARASDEAGRALASTVQAEAAQRAADLTAIRRGWAISDLDAARIFAEATDGRTEITGTPVYGCSLHGPIDDIGQVGAADPTSASGRWARLAMTSTVEGLQLTRTAGEALDGGARDVATRTDHWHRSVLARLAPMLPESDRAYVLRQSSS
jgi:hypothetical protein